MKDQFIGIHLKQKNEYRYFLESNFVEVNRLFVLVHSNQNGNDKTFKTPRYYLPKGIIKNYNVIINGKNFYYQTIDSDIKRNEEIRKIKETGLKFSQGSVTVL